MNDNNIIYVDADTRKAVLQSGFKVGVVNDDSCCTLTFRINKSSDIDLTDLTFYVNTMSAQGSGDRLDCMKEEDDQYIFIKCLLKGTIFEAKGKATINLCGREYDSNNSIVKKWGSEDITVLVGSHTDADKVIEERYPSILEDLKSKIENLNITDEQLNNIATKVAAKGFYTKSEIDSMIADIDLSSYQTKTDDTLNTTSKEVVGAINENTSNISELKSDLEQLKQNGTGTGTGLSTEAINKLEEVGNYLAYTTADGGAKWTELISILRNGSSGGGSGEGSGETEKTLSSISATYTGGEVTIGTALSDLTGIIVTATYSDGTTKTVTGYTLSGEILDGENTITVTYGGKTTTFTVTGIILPTDGLYGFFDLRNPQTIVGDWYTSVEPLQGSGVGKTYLNTTSKDSAFNEYGLVSGSLWLCDSSVYGNEANSKDLGTEFSICIKHYGGIAVIGDYTRISNIQDTYCILNPKYNTSSSTAIVTGYNVQGSHNNNEYHNINMVVNGETLKFYLDGTLIKTYNGSDYEDFVSWYSKNVMSTWYNIGKVTAIAIYTKALNEVEIVEINEYLKTLEVA